MYAHACPVLSLHSPRCRLQVRVCPANADSCVIQPLSGWGQILAASTSPQQPSPPRPPPPARVWRKEPEQALTQLFFPSPGRLTAPLPVGPLLASASLQVPGGKRGGASQEGARLAFTPSSWKKRLSRHLLSPTVSNTDCESPPLPGPKSGLLAGKGAQLRQVKTGGAPARAHLSRTPAPAPRRLGRGGRRGGNRGACG